VLERLKADERLHNVPVIMISGLQETDSVIRCIEAGAEDYLSKPFNPFLLRARISACLERKRWRDRDAGRSGGSGGQSQSDLLGVRCALPTLRHREAIAEFALAMLAALDEVNAAAEVQFEIRIGIHTGPVIAGVIGSRRFLYDIWGDTVNLASRLESHGMPGRIHVSERTSRMLRHSYDLEARDLIDVKGIGKIRTAFLTGRSGGARTGPLAGILDEA